VSVGAWTIVVALVIVAADVIGGQVRWRELAPSAALAATALIPLALAARSGFTGADVDARVFEILFFNRSPHHYSFTAFNTGRQLDMVVVASVALVSEHLLRLERRSLRLVILTILGLGLMSAFFLHVVYWPLPVRLFPYRLSPLLTALAAVLAIALAVRPDLPRAHRTVGLLGVGALILSGDRDALLNGVNDAVVATLMISTGIAVLVVVARQHYRAPAADLSLCTSLLTVIALTLTVGFLVSSPPAHTTDWLTAEQRDVVELIGQVVPSGETMLTPPDEAYIRYSTARAIVVDFKAFPMAGDEMVEWRQRLEDVTGRSIRTDGAGGTRLLRELTAAYRQRSRTDLETVARHYDASYLLVAADSVAGRQIADDGTAAMWEAGGFTLARIDPS
jgi:hypothetical protein